MTSGGTFGILFTKIGLEKQRSPTQHDPSHHSVQPGLEWPWASSPAQPASGTLLPVDHRRRRAFRTDPLHYSSPPSSSPPATPPPAAGRITQGNQPLLPHPIRAPRPSFPQIPLLPHQRTQDPSIHPSKIGLA